MNKLRSKIKSAAFAVFMNIVSVVLSVGTMIYAVGHFGLREAWPELVLTLLYIACIIMICMYFYGSRITAKQFNYRCSVCIGIAVLLRDILFPPPIAFFSLHLVCLVFAVMLLVMLTYFYARKEWKTYSRRNLWMLYIIDTVIAILYSIAIYLEPVNEYTAYLLTEIWIRPTIIYGLVVCFVLERVPETKNIKWGDEDK